MKRCWFSYESQCRLFLPSNFNHFIQNYQWISLKIHCRVSFTFKKKPKKFTNYSLYTKRLIFQSISICEFLIHFFHYKCCHYSVHWKFIENSLQNILDNKNSFQISYKCRELSKKIHCKHDIFYEFTITRHMNCGQSLGWVTLNSCLSCSEFYMNSTWLLVGRVKHIGNLLRIPLWIMSLLRQFFEPRHRTHFNLNSTHAHFL